MKKKTDLAKLQGTWHVIDFPGAKIVIEGDRFTSLSMGAEYEGTMKVDESKSPKAFDLKFTKGPEKGNINAGIYEIKGDTWRFCLNTRGKKRPTDFSASPEQGIAMQAMSRAEAKAAKPKPKESAVPAEPSPEVEGEWVMAECVQSGQPIEEQYLKLGKRVAKNGETTVTMGGNVMVKARYTVDRTKKPMTMDYLLANGKTQHGIYKLEGAKLTVCFAGAGKDRPREFESRKGDGRTFTVWKLVKK